MRDIRILGKINGKLCEGRQVFLDDAFLDSGAIDLNRIENRVDRRLSKFPEVVVVEFIEINDEIQTVELEKYTTLKNLEKYF